MRKKFLSALMLGALTLAATSTITSCKDYDGDVADVKKDVTSLQELVKKLDTAIAQANNDHATKAALETAQKTLQDAIDKKADKTEVEKAIAEAKGSLEAAINLKADKTALEQLQKDFAAYKTLVSETYVELGKYEAALAAQKKVDDAQDAVDAAIKADIDKLLAEVKSIKETDTDLDNRVKALEASIKELSTKLGSLDVMAQAIASDLRSLVYMPYLYEGGIETIEYPFFNAVSLVENTNDELKYNRESDNQPIEVLKKYDYVAATGANAEITVPLVGSVDYHVNPASANIAYGDIVGYNVREITTRSADIKAPTTATSPEKYYEGGMNVFKKVNGVLTAGIKFASTDDTKAWLNDAAQTKKIIVALQVKTKNGIKDSIVTSDYAKVKPERIGIEALAFNNKNIKGGNNQFEEENCASKETKCLHLWDTPKKAIVNNKVPAFNVYCMSKTGITLEDSLCVHIFNADENAVKNGFPKGTSAINFKSDEMKKLGLVYEFHVVEYKSGANKTEDSKYCKLDPNTGLFIPKDVKADGTTADESSESAAGRQPVVQVLVKHKDTGKVLLDGYILINLTATPEQPIKKDSVVIADYAPTTLDWTVCGTDTLNKATKDNTWAQFDTYVLDNAALKAKLITKNNFDQYYSLEKYNDIEEESAGQIKSSAKVFIYDGGNYSLTTDYGFITVNQDQTGTTNHTFDWYITAAQLEALMHGMNTPKELTVFFRFKANNANEKLEYIYVKLQATVTRHQYENTWSEKNANYWFAANGDDGGKEAIFFDVMAPGNTVETTITGNHDTEWYGEIKNTLVGNAIKINGAAPVANKQAAKFYFVPGTGIKVAGWDIITEEDNKLICSYDESKTFDYDKLDEVINTHAIAYTAGVFNNNRLYAKKGDKTVEIAVMDRETGKITLFNNETTQELLNSIGSAHANIQSMLRARVGVIYTDNDCMIARKVKDNEFTVAWQRPIDVKPGKKAEVIDAKTNENKVNIVELLDINDWRGESMNPGSNYNGANTWFWSYYQIESITVDVAAATTTMNGGTLGTTKLSDVTNEVYFTAYGKTKGQKGVFEFYPTIKNWNTSGSNNAINTSMKGNPEVYGQISYQNNGGNVTDFTVRIPVTVTYKWGSQKTYIDIDVKRTSGN